MARIIRSYDDDTFDHTYYIFAKVHKDVRMSDIIAAKRRIQEDFNEELRQGPDDALAAYERLVDKWDAKMYTKSYYRQEPQKDTRGRLVEVVSTAAETEDEAAANKVIIRQFIAC